MNIRILERKFDNISIVNDRNEIIYGFLYEGINTLNIRNLYFDFNDFTRQELTYIKNNVKNLPIINIKDYTNKFYFNNLSVKDDVVDLLISNDIDFIHHFNSYNMAVIKSREPLSDSILTMMKLLGV